MPWSSRPRRGVSAISTRSFGRSWTSCEADPPRTPARRGYFLAGSDSPRSRGARGTSRFPLTPSDRVGLHRHCSVVTVYRHCSVVTVYRHCSVVTDRMQCPDSQPRALLSVDLLQLARRPGDGVFRLRPLHALGEHVHDDVLRVDLGGLCRWLSRVAEDPRIVGRRAEALHRLVDRVPQRILLPERGRPDREAFRHLNTLAVLFLAVEPLQEILGQLLVLPVLHDGMVEGCLVARRASRTRGQPRVLDVTHHRLALLVLDLVLPALGRDVDRGSIQRGADLAAQEGAIVV